MEQFKPPIPARKRTMHHVERIIELLRQRGRATVAELAVELGLTPRYVKYELIEMVLIVAGSCVKLENNTATWVCRDERQG